MHIIIETQTFPPVSFFARAMQSEGILIEVQENYQKRSLRNKFLILSANGPQLLTIPLVKGKNDQKSIVDVSISYDQNWPKQFKNHLQSAYGKSPFYLFYEMELFRILDSGIQNLAELNFNLLVFVIKKTGINFTVGQTEAFLLNYSGNYCDLRNRYTLKGGLAGVKDVYYPQVFEHKFGFVRGLSILDLLFNMGNESINILKQYDFQ
ncbi:MAG TPA: WbqC family protein [Saprospiraceae bacterium]|nr:WbqC family protein [Saprospiraceae bacterium]